MPEVLGRLVKWMMMAVFPLTALGSVSITVTWSPSPDASVTGYDLYYGTASHDYTNMVSVGNTTSVVIDNLSENTTYYFAAKAHDDAGDESEFSNEASFGDYLVNPNQGLNLTAKPSSVAGDQIVFTLAPGAPAGVNINPTTGALSWKPGMTDANLTSSITVILTDLTNPSATTQMNLVVTVLDYLNLQSASVPVQTGQSASLPLVLTASDGVCDLVAKVTWPADRLQNPWLSVVSPVAGGTLVNQGTSLVIHLWTANGDAITGTNSFAQIHFQAAAAQTSAFVAVPISVVAATKPDGSTFSNPMAETDRVIVVGANPLLQPNASASQGRTLTLYANPGTSYQLQYATSLQPPVRWQPALNCQPTNVEQTINLDSANPVVYYRLMQQ